jgi:hypothetical protein
MDWFEYWLIFDDEECVETHSVICSGLDEAMGLFDELYLQLHLSGAVEDYGLTSDRRPSAIALREKDGEENLASYELHLDVMR